MVKCAIVIACWLVQSAAIATDQAGSSDRQEEVTYALFEKFASSPHVRRPGRELATQVLASSVHGRRVAMDMLGEDEMRPFMLACAVLGAVPLQDAYDALRAVAKDGSRPIKSRAYAARVAASLAGGGLFYRGPNIRLEGEAELRALEEWLDRHPPRFGSDHIERVGERLREVRRRIREAIERDPEELADLEDEWKTIGFLSHDLGLAHRESDQDALRVLVEHARDMLSMPPAEGLTERLIVNTTNWFMHQAYWHACPDPEWLPAVRSATTRDELQDLLDAVDFEPDRLSARPRTRACVERLRVLGFAIGEDKSPSHNLSALHEAVRSTDLRAAFLAGEVLHAMGVASWPLPPPPENAPLVVDAWRSVVLGESALHAAETGTAPAWDETRQAWILAPLRN